MSTTLLWFDLWFSYFQFSSVNQSCPTLWTLWTAAHQASLSITNSWSLLKLMSIESVMSSNHLILCSLLLLPSFFPSIRVFSSESVLSVLQIRWVLFSCFVFVFCFVFLLFFFLTLGWCKSDIHSVENIIQILIFFFPQAGDILSCCWAAQWATAPSHESEKPTQNSCVHIHFRSVAQSCLTLCDPMDCSTPGFPVHHQHLEFSHTHVRRVSDTIQPSHPLSSPSPPAFNLSQQQGSFWWVSSSHKVTKY